MDTHANRQRLLDAGFTERQTEAILEVLDRATGQVVTRDFLDDRLGRYFQLTREYFDRRLLETSEHVDAVLASGLQRQKRELLAWMVTMLAPLYAVVIFLAIWIGA